MECIRGAEARYSGFSEITPDLVKYYKITDDTGKITEKTEFSESLTSSP